jgi:CheY-like chemotaxis protein
VSLTTHTDGNHLFFTVKDSGIGMSPEILDRLFQRFEQADGSTSRRFGGSGLGLFISLNLAEMMGGTIDVSSQEEVGSIFELILPYRPSELWEKREKKRSYNSSVLDQKLSGYVLVAEDTPELQLLERRILEGMGLTVTTANNGKEAIDLASSQSFDLILMDMQMPEIDGIEATKMLRSENNQTPIVALTANVMQKHRDAFYEAGCDGFIAKPIDKQELKRELKKHLH